MAPSSVLNSRPLPPSTPTPTLAPTPTADNREHLQVFETVWGTVNETYFDPGFGGVDWEALHDEYAPLIAAAPDDETFYDLLNRMLWELNVSHVGVGPAAAWPPVEPVIWESGEIGVDVRLLNGPAVIPIPPSSWLPSSWRDRHPSAASGSGLEGYGVIPDIPVTLDRGQLLKGVDAQLQTAIQYIAEAAQ